LKKYFHPTNYKILLNKKTDEKTNYDSSCNLDISNINISIKSFHLKVHGIQVIINNESQKKSLLITGIIDDIIVDILNNKHIQLKLKQINENIPNENEFKTEYFAKFIESLTLKDLLIYKHTEIYGKYMGYVSNLYTIKVKSMNQTVKEFISGDLFAKRIMIIQLLLYYDKHENQYLAYLLYDLLSNDINGNIDTQEQIILFDSFPWTVKNYFRDAMKKTIQYTNDLTNFDIQKIPLEQQICLLKIPFGIYKKEPILNIMNDIKKQFINMVKLYDLPNIQMNYLILI
jgi:hypothetical protein